MAAVFQEDGEQKPYSNDQRPSKPHLPSQGRSVLWIKVLQKRPQRVRPVSDGRKAESSPWVIKYLEANLAAPCFIKRKVHAFLNYFVNHVEG